MDEAYMPGKGADVCENRLRDSGLICMEELFCGALLSSSSLDNVPSDGIYGTLSVGEMM